MQNQKISMRSKPSIKKPQDFRLFTASYPPNLVKTTTLFK